VVPTEEHFRRIEQTYQAALSVEATRRSEFLRQACGDDEHLRREVESLLRYQEEAETFLRTAALLKHAPLVGCRLGPYAVESLLGVGGMGEVYKARDTRLSRRVAIKVLPPEAVTDTGRIERLRQEARAASALDHPNIVTIYDVTEYDNRSCIIMQCVEGRLCATCYGAASFQ
jgi:eukaryotic-like serine/threonine-protein kinase